MTTIPSGTDDDDPLYSVIPKDHCAAIGRVTIAWADFELAVDRAIWILLRVDQQIGACVTAQFGSMFNRFNALLSLALERGVSPPTVAKLGSLAGGLGSLSEARNRIVHDARFVQGEQSEISRFHVTAKKKLSFEHRSETVVELLAICKKMNLKRGEFIALWKDVVGELPPPDSEPTRYRQLVFPDVEEPFPSIFEE